MALSANIRESRSHAQSQSPERHDAPFNGSPIADIVSLESVVNLLIQKGLCTPEELFQEERKRHEYEQDFRNVPLVQTERALSVGGPASVDRAKGSWLKRKMSKRRWSRKLGTSLFGWQWKKVKVNRNATGLPRQI